MNSLVDLRGQGVFSYQLVSRQLESSAEIPSNNAFSHAGAQAGSGLQ